MLGDRMSIARHPRVVALTRSVRRGYFALLACAQERHTFSRSEADAVLRMADVPSGDVIEALRVVGLVDEVDGQIEPCSPFALDACEIFPCMEIRARWAREAIEEAGR